MLNARRPHFLVVFHPTVCSERLKVPVKFTKHLEGRRFGSVLLIGPSGNSWNVELSRHNDELFLGDGWPAFVKDHCLQYSDSLVFRYDGNLQFSVQIFDQTSCEKEVAFYAKHSDSRLVSRKRDLDRDYSAAYVGIQKKPRGICSPDYLECKSPSTELKMDKCGDESLRPIKVSKGAKRKKSARQPKPKAAEKKASSISSFIEQRAAQYFVSDYPYFVRVMKPSNVSSSGTLKVPVRFSREHLPNCRTNVVLRNLKGDCWTLSSVPTLRLHAMHTLCAGWTGFVRDNDIKIEDICIFELVGERDMRVHVVRLGLEGLDFEGLKGRINGCAVPPAQFSSKKGDFVPRSSKGKHPKNDLSEGIMDGTCLEPESRDPVVLSTKFERDPHGSNLNGHASSETWSQRKDGAWGYEGSLSSQTEEGDPSDPSGRSITAALSTDGTGPAEFFESPFPNFMKVMKISNISGPYTMNIPSKFATAHFPCCRTEIVLRNLKGESWTVNSYPSSIRCTAHTLCGGWMSFVRANEIKLGDVCVFELVAEKELQVHIFKNEERNVEPPHARSDASTGAADSTGRAGPFGA